MKSYEVISLDLFSTLVYVETENYNPWATLEDAIVHTPYYKEDIHPYVSVEELSEAYYSQIRQLMENKAREVEFSNIDVILDVFSRYGIDSDLTHLHQIASTIIQNYFNNILQLIKIYPEVHETLEYLRNRGYTLVLSSNHSFPQNGWSVLEKYDLGSYFTQITFSGQIGWRKPSKKFFTKALSGVSYTDKQRIIHVGDDPLSDVRGAMAFGIHALWIRSPDQKERTIEGVIAIIEEFRQLPKYV
ncbi:MAG: HAD family hydrolase [Candidatus Heimdallarchaeota archaeon]